ncbi:MAG: GtrA family protein [Candidatus Nealsonbacteria bacterium]
MKKIDIILALITGEITAWLFAYLSRDIKVLAAIDNLWLILALSFPVLAVFGLWVCFKLSNKFLWIYQMAKYLLIGVMATIVDLGILNVLIFTFGISIGIWYSVFKGISFVLATMAKYFGDKLWAFEKTGKEGMGKEFINFFLVSLVGLGFNVAIASFVVNVMGPQFNMSLNTWASVGGIAAAFGVTAWNFIGYKFFVFKK